MIRYEIRLQGHLPPDWADWFEGLCCTHLENGETLLTGRLADQGALHGVLNRIRDLNLKLLSVNRLPPREEGQE